MADAGFCLDKVINYLKQEVAGATEAAAAAEVTGAEDGATAGGYSAPPGDSLYAAAVTDTVCFWKA